ncbi:LacI family DNA-binding transcriptional regulator [Paenibacillus athensensis]|uniref:HTH lacI-type domain-containing protein n=1 Tax=Paenibacillus athensensis TaxID=1967502 RepID=A0A4Y8Q0S0_9BACL|nr:LacI family DNA-binding transcriptional regulator [Paenibacillus athensensis]MCD1261401.1 LacI family DNA-binding transcriptional regulator [Paenibacillus athensensis]
MKRKRNPAGHRVTTLDLASRLGLSIATVDRALNNRGSVSAKTRDRVLRAVEELGYLPNRSAKYLSQKVRCTVGVSYMLPPWLARQVDEGLRRAEEELWDYGLKLIIRSDAGSSEEQMEQIRAMLPAIDGLAVAPRETGGFTEFIEGLTADGLPVVTFNNDLPISRPLLYVGSDYEAAGRLGGRLMSLLARRSGDLGIVVRNGYLPNMEQRIAGFRGYFTANPDLHVLGPFQVPGTQRDTAEHIYQMLQRHPNLIGLFAASDNLAEAAEAVKRSDRGGQVALVGFDMNERYAELIREGTVSAVICQEPFYQGYYPINALFDYIVEKQRPRHARIITRLEVVLRENVDHYNRFTLY